MSIVEFMRFGKSFSVGDLLRLGPIRARIAASNSLSHTEFSYPIFQAYDWYKLAKKFNCYFQVIFNLIQFLKIIEKVNMFLVIFIKNDN